MKTIAGVNMTEDLAAKLTNFDIDNLDSFEAMRYNDFEKHGKEFALQILINTVEGDFSQLSEELAEIAEEQYLNFDLN